MLRGPRLGIKPVYYFVVYLCQPVPKTDTYTIQPLLGPDSRVCIHLEAAYIPEPMSAAPGIP